MKIVTWNVNGIRALKIKLHKLFESLDADIICLQETKVTRDMLDESSAIVEGYNSYFSFSRKKTGYSGVATFCKDAFTPSAAEEGLSGLLTSKPDGCIASYGNLSSFSQEELESLDGEGRMIITQHLISMTDGTEKKLAIMNVYVPRGPTYDEERHDYMMRFLALLQTRAEALLAYGSHVIIMGDFNVVHKAADHCDTECEEFKDQPSRRWLNQMLWKRDENTDLEHITDRATFRATTIFTEGRKFCDSFRYFHPSAERAYTQWSTELSARLTNYGKRLDYILPDVELLQKCFLDCEILSDVEGSDHCPVRAKLDCQFVAAKRAPPLCTKFMPEFAGRQQKLSVYFTKSVPPLSANNPDLAIVVKSHVTSSPSQESLSSVRLTPQKRTSTNDRKQPNKLQKMTSKKLEGAKQASLFSFFKSSNQNLVPLSTNSDSQSSLSEMTEIIDLQSPYFYIDSKSGVSANEYSQEQSGNNFPEINCSGHAVEEINQQSFVSAELEENDSMDKTEAKECIDINSQSQMKWQTLLSGPPPPPLCPGHNLPCKLITVKKAGANKGRQFYICQFPKGHKGDKDVRCDFFRWYDHKMHKNK